MIISPIPSWEVVITCIAMALISGWMLVRIVRDILKWRR
jgi:hypothetical protein